MTEEKYRLEITSYHGSTWTTTWFEGKEDIEILTSILKEIGDLDSVSFRLADQRKLFLPRDMIQSCVFILEKAK